MRRITLACAVLALAAGLAPSCSCTHQSVPRSYAAPTVEQLLAHVRKQGESVRSYKAESKMDYWVGNERVKATVHVMGERGAKVFFKAINPASGSSAADLVCNGQDFVFLNYDRNCQLSGQCDRRAIGQLLRVSMEPDDFLLLAVGSVPLIDQPTGTVRWDEKRGAEVVELVSRDKGWRQTLVLDGRGGTGKWDVLESVVKDAKGQVDWKVQNKGFKALSTSDGRSVRVPQATRFEQPRQKADLQVRWEERTLNEKLPGPAFEREVPAGLAACGAKRRGGGAAAR
jgi:hypothetical protein